MLQLIEYMTEFCIESIKPHLGYMNLLNWKHFYTDTQTIFIIVNPEIDYSIQMKAFWSSYTVTYFSSFKFLKSSENIVGTFFAFQVITNFSFLYHLQFW